MTDVNYTLPPAHRWTQSLIISQRRRQLSACSRGVWLLCCTDRVGDSVVTNAAAAAAAIVAVACHHPPAPRVTDGQQQQPHYRQHDTYGIAAAAADDGDNDADFDTDCAS